MLSFIKLLLLTTQLTAGILSIAGLSSVHSFTPSHPSHGDRPLSPSYFSDNDNDNDDDDIPTKNLLNAKENFLADHSTKEQIKRSMSMLRMGRASAPLNLVAVPVTGDQAETLRLSESIDDVTSEKTRRSMMSMLRMGRSNDDNDDDDDEMAVKRAMMSMLRMGRALENKDDGDTLEMEPVSEEKRSMAMLRLGRQSWNSDEPKRSMAMLRLGRNFQPKRSMSMLRLG